MVRIGALILAAVAARQGAPFVIAATPDKIIAMANIGWSSRRELPFARMSQLNSMASAGITACSGSDLCLRQTGPGPYADTITLVGEAEDARSSGRYLAAQTVILSVVAPGADPAVLTAADRVAFATSAGQAQFGPYCAHVQRLGVRSLTTAFVRRRCGR